MNQTRKLDVIQETTLHFTEKKHLNRSKYPDSLIYNLYYHVFVDIVI